MKQYKYKFSVVIPVYNVEEYLSETIDSVINQTIDFKKNIQIILVNDGSPDNSEEICIKYTNLFPENIVYVKQKNAGVSAARNKGLEYVEGEFINFLDSDDIWEKDVFEKVYKIYKENEDIDVVGVRQKYFEALNTYPSLDYKFDDDKIVDIFNDYDHIQLSVTSGFFRTSSIGDVRYDTRVKYSEDAKFLIEIILKKEKLGIISSSLHLYRKRFSETSAIQTKNTKDDWYLITPELCYKYLFELSKKKYGYVIPYIQYYVMYDYQFRIRETIPTCIKEETIKKYLELTKELLTDISDEIIIEQKNMHAEYKIQFLNMKYGDITNKFKYKKHELFYNGNCVINLLNSNILNINIIDFDKNEIEIRGTFNLFVPKEDYELYVVTNNKEKKKIDLIDSKIYNRKAFNESFISNKGIKIRVAKENLKKIHFELVYNKNYKTILNFNTGLNSKIDRIGKTYFLNDNKIYYCSNNYIKTKQKNFTNILLFKCKFIANLIKRKEIKVLIYRLLYCFANLFNHKKIWLISDRPPVANDNGFALFKYIVGQNNPNIDAYFVINKDSKDFEKVKRTGKYLIYNSLKYKIYFLMADKIISSQADKWVTNAFGRRMKYYKDLYKADFIFLQHGIIVNDLSIWLNCYEKDIKIFCTTNKNEYNSIINGKYGFKEDVVKLTGLPRYDLLNDESTNLVAIMPTWRMDLAGTVDGLTGMRKPNPMFKNSDYYKFYSSLINDERLLKVMKEKGYKGIFLVHPSHNSNSEDFSGNGIIKVEKDIANYNEIFKKSKLVISDYSSAPFDFAYMNKPVIYTQFDKEKFFQNHLCDTGYFDYEKDGLGPVMLNYETTLEKIIETLKKDCKIDSIYEKRIKNFYIYNDKENSKRVYEEILKLDKDKK